MMCVIVAVANILWHCAVKTPCGFLGLEKRKVVHCSAMWIRKRASVSQVSMKCEAFNARRSSAEPPSARGTIPRRLHLPAIRPVCPHALPRKDSSEDEPGPTA